MFHIHEIIQYTLNLKINDTTKTSMKDLKNKITKLIKTTDELFLGMYISGIYTIESYLLSI